MLKQKAKSVERLVCDENFHFFLLFFLRLIAEDFFSLFRMMNQVVSFEKLRFLLFKEVKDGVCDESTFLIF